MNPDSYVCLSLSGVRLLYFFCDCMDWSPPGSSLHKILLGNPGVGCHFLLQESFPTQGSNPGLLCCRQILSCLRHQGGLQTPIRGSKKAVGTKSGLCSQLPGLKLSSAVSSWGILRQSLHVLLCLDFPHTPSFPSLCPLNS